MKKLQLLIAGAALLAASSCTTTPSETDALTSTDAARAVIGNIMTRTSVRQYTDRPISADTLETLLKAGMAAPTAVNKQPWAFVVTTGRDALDSLATLQPRLQTAAAAITVCGDMARAIEGEGRDFWVQDCSAATENILLAAHALGLGAVWTGVYPIAERVDDVSRALALPDSVVPMCIIAVGYPLADQEPKDKWDPSKVHYQRW
ncbi:MAG: nitroreductase family protein [Muribaculaceae bacterium]